jgi:hypothetical protein
MMSSDSSHEAETARLKLRKLLAELGCSWNDLSDVLAATAAPNFAGDTATSLVEKGVFPRGKPLTPDGKLFWKIADSIPRSNARGGRRILKGPDGPTARLSPRRIGITKRNNRLWQGARGR